MLSRRRKTSTGTINQDRTSVIGCAVSFTSLWLWPTLGARFMFGADWCNRVFDVMSSRVLEASAEENLARIKRVKRSEGQTDMSSPADWIRQDDWPVGIRNVGNTCWFSAVIQVSRTVWSGSDHSDYSGFITGLYPLNITFIFEDDRTVNRTVHSDFLTFSMQASLFLIVLLRHNRTLNIVAHDAFSVHLFRQCQP